MAGLKVSMICLIFMASVKSIQVRIILNKHYQIPNTCQQISNGCYQKPWHLWRAIRSRKLKDTLRTELLHPYQFSQLNLSSSRSSSSLHLKLSYVFQYYQMRNKCFLRLKSNSQIPNTHYQIQSTCQQISNRCYQNPNEHPHVPNTSSKIKKYTLI